LLIGKEEIFHISTNHQKNEEEEKWENKIIDEKDPDVQNPLMKINEEVALTQAQNEMIDQIAKIRDSVNLENE